MILSAHWPSGRVFANGPGDVGSILGCIIPKTLKMVLDTSLLNTQQYKVCIKGKMEQSRERIVPFPTHWCSSYWKGAFWLPSTKVANFTLYYDIRILLWLKYIIILLLASFCHQFEQVFLWSLIDSKSLQAFNCPVGWGYRIHWLLHCRGVRPLPPMSVLDTTLNNLMVRFQQCWSFGECGVPLHCHRSQVHSGPEW